MDKFIYIAMTGAKQNMASLAVRANNLANANTDGFKADLEHGRSLQALGKGLPTRVFALTENPFVDFSQGNYKTTQRQLDVAITGKGFIAVEDENGKEAYSRSGSLSFDETGMLKNAKGNPILGDSGPIFIPLPVDKVSISSEGVITIRPQGAPPEVNEAIGQIKLVMPDHQLLTKGKDGLFHAVFGNPFEFNPDVTLKSGVIEGSNVNPVTEMISIIDNQRQFEMQIKMMKTAEENAKSSASLMRIS